MMGNKHATNAHQKQNSPNLKEPKDQQQVNDIQKNKLKAQENINILT
jgi:hypothetical protein